MENDRKPLPLPSTSSPPQRSQYLAAANRLLRQFANPTATDPQTFLIAIVSVMMHYPLDVVEQIIDPFFGLPGRQNWTPTPFDVKKACDELMRPRLQAERWRSQVTAQLCNRERQENGQRPTFEDLRAQCAKIGIHFSSRQGAATAQAVIRAEDAERARLNLGLTQAEWDALPTQEEYKAHRARNGSPQEWTAFCAAKRKKAGLD